jgi:hypothetical protein
MSTMYLKASGKMSGSVNLPTPIAAAAPTYPSCGLRKEANLTSGYRENSAFFIFGRLRADVLSGEIRLAS